MTEWKKIDGFEVYEVSNTGSVRNSESGLILKQTLNTGGYPSVTLVTKEKRKCATIHRLVAAAFIQNPDNLPEVNHIDEDKTNNTVENLEWVTKKENMNHGTRTQRASEKKYKRVVQYSINGQPIKVWESVKEAEKNGFFHSAISACCYGKRKTHLGYAWGWAE